MKAETNYLRSIEVLSTKLDQLLLTTVSKEVYNLLEQKNKALKKELKEANNDLDDTKIENTRLFEDLMVEKSKINKIEKSKAYIIITKIENGIRVQTQRAKNIYRQGIRRVYLFIQTYKKYRTRLARAYARIEQNYIPKNQK